MSEEGIRINVKGYPARIEDIFASYQYDFTKGRVEAISVWVKFDEAVNGMATIVVNIPMREYNKKEFVREVMRGVEESLRKIQMREREESEKEARFQYLKEYVEELKKKLGLAEQERREERRYSD